MNDPRLRGGATLLYSLEEGHHLPTAKSWREAHRMGDTIIITPQIAGIIVAIIGLAATLLSVLARAFIKRLEQAAARIEQRFEKLEARIEQLDARDEQRFKDQEARNERRFEKQEARNEQRFKDQEARNEQRYENQEARNQQRHSEIQAELRDLNTRVGRLEGTGRVHDRSAGRSGPQSPRRDDDSAAAPEGASDPAPVAKHFEQSMVPPAGGRSEPQHAAGLARQAVPDEQPGGETVSEPSEEESPDTSQ